MTLDLAHLRKLLTVALSGHYVERAATLDAQRLLILLVQVTAVALEQLRQREVEAPLSLARLWTHPTAETDQRAQVVLSLAAALSVALGGNRSGKTHGAFDADVAVALGRHHPHTQAFCRLNHIDPKLIPVGPGEVMLIAPSAGSSRRDHRRQIAARLPPGAKWYGQNGLAEAYVTIPVPGSRNEAVIWFKSVDQGARAYKGSQARRYHIDEEPEGEEGRAVLEECLRGASAVGGKVVITATPQAGLTWMVEKLVQGKEYGAITTRLNSLHNRLVPDYGALVAWLDSMGEEERAMRERGEWVDRRGAIYPQWSHGVHVVPRFDIPAEWTRFRGLDFGQRNPTAVVWVAVRPDGQLIVYRVRRAAQTSYEQWAAIIHEAEGATQDEGGAWRGHTETVELAWGDPSDPGAIETLCLCDVPVLPAHREVKLGISAVREALRFRSDGSPGLVVFEPDEESGTAALIEEVVGYRYDPNDKRDKPLKARDHVMDALRYVVRGAQLWDGRWMANAGPLADAVDYATVGAEDEEDGEEAEA
jgi:hypothetical protein